MLDRDEIRKIAEEEGTPCFVFDLVSLKNRVEEMRRIADGKYHLTYSIKANPFLTGVMAEMTDHLEVCSPGEMNICRSLRVPADKIIYSGVNKTAEDIRDAMEYGAGLFTAESRLHVELIQKEAEREGKRVPLILRLSAGSQFGMSKEDLLYIMDHQSQYPNLKVEGIHYFAGTQRKLKGQLKELEMLKEFLAELKERYQMPSIKLEYGPGFSTVMFEKDDFSDTLKPMKDLHEELSSLSEIADLTIEMGRFYTTYCGTYISKVMDLKATQGVNYCIIDGGINHVNYYGSMMGMNVPVTQHIQTTENTDEKTWCICGSLCSTNDVLIRNYNAVGLSIGDLIAFENIGAYSVTEGIGLFLSRKLPKILLRQERNSYLIARNFTESSDLNTPAF